ncbi:hypothetical protein BDV33DRAFT_204989 [Aspergillus novoparasiticus]|uniref:Uncharacterized protein n=1 Tax=Aspergillus novoparasiticus TaxID=986946 RepID=A0A5N6EMT9_9EURO|nr:hypothetical protein BDV33DRAFT_204989 [Aspergillus novoparasiticus]
MNLQHQDMRSDRRFYPRDQRIIPLEAGSGSSNADIRHVFLLKWQYYLPEGCPLGEEITAAVAIRDGKLLPLRASIPEMLTTPNVIKHISEYPVIGMNTLIIEPALGGQRESSCHCL